MFDSGAVAGLPQPCSLVGLRVGLQGALRDRALIRASEVVAGARARQVQAALGRWQRAVLRAEWALRRGAAEDVWQRRASGAEAQRAHEVGELRARWRHARDGYVQSAGHTRRDGIALSQDGVEGLRAVDQGFRDDLAELEQRHREKFEGLDDACSRLTRECDVAVGKAAIASLRLRADTAGCSGEGHGTEKDGTMGDPQWALDHAPAAERLQWSFASAPRPDMVPPAQAATMDQERATITASLQLLSMHSEALSGWADLAASPPWLPGRKESSVARRQRKINSARLLHSVLRRCVARTARAVLFHWAEARRKGYRASSGSAAALNGRLRASKSQISKQRCDGAFGGGMLLETLSTRASPSGVGKLGSSTLASAQIINVIDPFSPFASTWNGQGRASSIAASPSLGLMADCLSAQCGSDGISVGTHGTIADARVYEAAMRSNLGRPSNAFYLGDSPISDGFENSPVTGSLDFPDMKRLLSTSPQLPPLVSEQDDPRQLWKMLDLPRRSPCATAPELSRSEQDDQRTMRGSLDSSMNGHANVDSAMRGAKSESVPLSHHVDYVERALYHYQESSAVQGALAARGAEQPMAMHLQGEGDPYTARLSETILAASACVRRSQSEVEAAQLLLRQGGLEGGNLLPPHLDSHGAHSARGTSLSPSVGSSAGSFGHDAMHRRLGW